MSRSIKAIFAVTGTSDELFSFEEILKKHGIEGVSSNPSARNLGYRWIVVYSDIDEDDKTERVNTFAYRSTSCKDTSRPPIIKLKTAKKRLASGYYFK
jgi:hypothetical protein